LDAACCKNLIPGVVLLPSGQKDSPGSEPKDGASSEPKATPMTAGVGVAIGVAAFLIIAPIIACSVWFCTPAKKRQSSKEGNVLTKKNRGSTGSVESENIFITYTPPSEIEPEKPAESD
jgi:hypothetical protein